MQYVPFRSDVEIPFYAALASRKINEDKLDDSARRLLGLYEIRPSDATEHSCRMQIHGNALTIDNPPAGFYRAEGTIQNFNTLEDYRRVDYSATLKQAGAKIWAAINDGSVLSNPSLLAAFHVISYADLKKYRFHYWFAFPALVMEPSWTPYSETAAQAGGSSSLPYKMLTPDQSTALAESFQAWRETVDPRQHGFFLAKRTRRPQASAAAAAAVSAGSTSKASSEGSDASQPRARPTTTFASLGFVWAIAPLAAYDTGFFEGEYSEDCFVSFADPSNYSEPGPVAPAWCLRNLLALVRQKWKRDRVQILCYRETPSRGEAARSIILDMEVRQQPKKRVPTTLSVIANATATATADGSSSQAKNSPDADPSGLLPKVVGWERDNRNRLAGRHVNLTEYMDPLKLADSAVDLNLKLMKWRIAPGLDLEAIQKTKCLLLGAGTLGSYVSRNLLGWGVRHITFVDNGNVSFSNPVRQPLFNFADCLEGGKPKAPAAAAALKAIYPGVTAEGHVLSVPMAGHPVTDEAATKAEYEKLRQLVDEHDAIFLLMDSRESRYLPTVMGKAANKIVVNAALGFDTYVVMRHGTRSVSSSAAAAAAAASSSNNNNSDASLGCYFCNDVVAPSDSMKDLTLDQQCTVTRPGIAAIASALLVELLVSVVQHPLKAAAPASTTTSTNTVPVVTNDNDDDDNNDHPLGLVPHQIRGFLGRFDSLKIVGKAYDCCSACSEIVIKDYLGEGAAAAAAAAAKTGEEEKKKEGEGEGEGEGSGNGESSSVRNSSSGGWDFVRRVCDDVAWVEELSGLKEVQRQAEEAARRMEEEEALMDEDDDNDDHDDGELI